MSETEGLEERARSVDRSAGLAVHEADLGPRTRIGSGAATDVDRLEAFTVPGHQGGLAFTRIREVTASYWHPQTIRQLVAWRAGLDDRDRATLDGVAAWPLAAVENDDGSVVGCLVPLAALPFYYVPTDDTTRGKVPQPAKWLVVAPKRARRTGAAAMAERDLVARCTVLARVCVLLDLLHRNGIVFGDLSDRSVLFGAGEVSSAFVVGCEGAAFSDANGRAGEPQRNSAGWAAAESPSGDEMAAPGHPDASLSTAPSVQTVATDRYKLALLILRVLAPAGEGLERSRDPERIRDVLDEAGYRLMSAALSDEPAGRPSASDWYGYLRGVILENLAAPAIRSIEVHPELVAEGDEVRLDVQLTGARRLTIEMPGRADITREVGGRGVSERFTARQSGRIKVRATNEFGDAVALSNAVRVLPVPSPAQIAVAVPQVPEGLDVVPDLARLEVALGISLPPSSSGSGSAGGADAESPFSRVAALRDRLDADAVPLHDALRIGVEAERMSREQLVPSFEEFLSDVTSPKGRR